MDERSFATPELERLLRTSGNGVAKALHTFRSLAKYPFPLKSLEAYSALLVYREAISVGPALYERRVSRKAGAPMAYDIDDPIFLRAPSHTSPVVRVVRDHEKWKTICESAKVTICINEMIAERVAAYCQRVEVVPNAIDLAKYPPRQPGNDDGGKCVIGYLASHSTMALLLGVEPALRKVAASHPFTLHVMGAPSPVRMDNVREIPWTSEGEAQALAEFDIGLAPAEVNEWNSYKSFVKVLVYMAVGLPVIASPVGLPTRIIQDGVNGFLAGSEEEWIDRILQLLEDRELRTRMGAAARATIERDFALQKQLPRVLSIFQTLTAEHTA